MSNIEQKSFEIKTVTQKPKHLPPTESECRQNKCCRCLDCRHVCICANILPSLSKVEQETLYSCRSYECFLKHNHSICKEKNKAKMSTLVN